MIYAATNDGLLHGFKADVFTETNNEAWAMLMPAAMPLIKSSYPASDQFPLDGTLVAKDVVWDQIQTGISASACASGTTVTGPPGSGSCPWHTMLVGSYGSSQQGYYAVDVTNPTSPVFRWQLTKLPSTESYQIFGTHAATPAITTVTLNDSSGIPHEVGVAVLPGGISGSSTGGPCQRERDATGVTPGPDAMPASNYAMRNYVRCWGPNGGTTGGTTPNAASQADPVPGRSLSIVRLDTGEIVKVFARNGSTPGTDFATTDQLNSKGVVINTQLDSPMTGTPVVYPADVGALASRIFVGDEDGTLWRFDVSSPNPAQWFAEPFLDLYNTTVDPPGSATYGRWNDGQHFDVPITTSLDTTGSLVLNIATGITTQTYDTTGIQYVYSVSEKVGGTPAELRASVNWYWGPASTVTSTASAPRAGERVSGPMTVFDGTLYFTTYYAGTSASGCSPGQAKLWGFDFIAPQDPTSISTLSEGGKRNPLISCPSVPEDWLDPGVACGQIQSAVIPGVAVLATPACAAQATTTAGGVTHTSLSNVAQGSFSLVANIGATGSTPGTQFQQGLANPVAPTVIDSWASVVE
jgi:type IV pilus assembly protein PilY1